MKRKAFTITCKLIFFRALDQLSGMKALQLHVQIKNTHLQL